MKKLFLIINILSCQSAYMQSNTFKEIGEYTSKPTSDSYISQLNAARIAENNIVACFIYELSTKNLDTLNVQKFKYYENGFLKSWQNRFNSTIEYPPPKIKMDFDSLKKEHNFYKLLYRDTLIESKVYLSNGEFKYALYQKYNDIGKIVMSRRILKKSNINAINGKNFYEYDNKGRLVKEISYGGDLSWWMSFIWKFEYTYDNDDNLIEAKYFYKRKKKSDRIYKYSYITK